MTYSCTDFTDSVLSALKIPDAEIAKHEAWDDPAKQADLALAEIERLQQIEAANAKPAKIAVPTVHLNGTSSAALVDGLCEAIGAVNIAIKKMADAAPNGRDYYTQGQEAFKPAQDQHAARMQKLRAVKDELEQIAEAIVQS